MVDLGWGELWIQSAINGSDCCIQGSITSQSLLVIEIEYGFNLATVEKGYKYYQKRIKIHTRNQLAGEKIKI